MRKSNIVSALAIVLSLSACSKVEVGHVGLKVHMLGGEKGVDQEVLTPGRYWIGWNEELYTFPTATQNYTWDQAKRAGAPEDESITFQTVEGLSVNADIGITYHLDPAKIPDLFQKYRKGIDDITNVYMRNMVRDALTSAGSTKSAEYVYGQGKAELIRNVEADIRAKVAPIGIIVENIYLIGSFRLPDSVVASINAKINATQQAQQRENEVASATAEANKKIAGAKGDAESITLKAKAQADANRLLADSLTPALVQYEAIQHWNGALPTVSGAATPFVNIGGKP